MKKATHPACHMSKFDKWSHVLILVISTARPEDNELSSPESEEEDEQPMTLISDIGMY